MAKTGAIEKLKAMAKDRVDAKALKDFVAAGKDVPLSYKGREHVWAKKVKKYAAGGSANSKGKASNLSVLEMGDMSSPAYRAHLERKQGLEGSYPETFVAPAVRGAASAAKGFLGNLGKTKPGQLSPGHYEFANARRDAAMSQLTKQEMDTFYRTGNLPSRFPELLENASAIGSKVGRIPMPKPEKKTLQEHLVEGVMTPAGRRSAVDLGLNTANQMSDIYDQKGFAPAGDGKADSYAAGGKVDKPYIGYRRAGRRPESQQDRAASANIPVAVARGLVSGTLGMPGDLESLARIPYDYFRSPTMGELVTGDKTSKTFLPTSEDIEKRLPFRGASQTPVGQMFTGASQLAGGAYTGPLSGARAAMAVPRAIKRAGQDFVQSSGQTVSPLTVYHGSPHKFDKFDSSKIGTGEGAQSYGHGLYFAEAPGVASDYKRKLSDTLNVKGDATDLERRAAQMALTFGDNTSEGAVKWLSKYEGKGAEHTSPAMTPELIQSVKQKFSEGTFSPGGHLYTIDLPDEKIARMLDWDKPLSEQPEVIKALKGTDYEVGMSQKQAEKVADQRLREEADEWAEMTGGDPVDYSNNVDWESYVDRVRKESGSIDSSVTGKDLHRMIMRDEGYRPDMFDTENYQVGTSEALRGYGIPGIRYLDATSRDAGKGTSNFVVFPGEEDALTILERKKAGGEVKMAGGGAAFGRYTTGKKYQGAVKRAREADVNTLADPRTYAFVSGLLGSAPDQLGFSVMHPDYKNIQRVGEKGFMGGTILGVAPAVAPLTRGLPVGATIKPKGGNWLTGSVEKALKPLKGPYDTREARDELRQLREQVGDLPRYQEAERIYNNQDALDQWIDRNLTNYVKKEMATPEDPVRKLAEQGIDPQGRFQYALDRNLPTLEITREKFGFPPKGMGQSPQAQNWEKIADETTQIETAGDIIAIAQNNKLYGDTFRKYKNILEENPWLLKVDPSTPVYSPKAGNWSYGDTGFDHILDVLKQDLASGRIRPEQLNKVSMEQAVRRTYDFDQDMAKKMREAQIKATEGMPVHKEYPEGYKWIELAKPNAPENWMQPANLEAVKIKPNSWAIRDKDADKYISTGFDSPEKAVEHMKSIQGEKALEDALKYEGDTMGHCVGGYCPDVLEGRSRIYSLRDAKGEPHVTIEVNPSSQRVAPRHEEVLSEMKASGLDTNQLDELAYDIEYEQALQRVKQNRPPAIAQIKGKQNRAPNEEYLPFVQDFVRGGKWSDVGDLGNTGLYSAKDVVNHMPESFTMSRNARQLAIGRARMANEMPEYMTRAEYEALLQKHAPEDIWAAEKAQRAAEDDRLLRELLPPEGMKAGGEVKMAAGGIAKLKALLGGGAKPAKVEHPLVFPRAEPKTREEIRPIAQRVAEQMTGEFVRQNPKVTTNPAGKSRKQFERERNIPLETRNVVPEKNVPPVDYEKLKDYAIVGVPGDPSMGGVARAGSFDDPARATVELTRVGDITPDSPVPLFGGPRYGDYERFWASNFGAATPIQSNVNALGELYDAPVLGKYIKMAPDSANFAMHNLDSLLSIQRPEQLSKGKMEQLNRLIRNGSPKYGKFPGFSGFDDPVDVLLQSQLNSDLRKHIAETLTKPTITQALGLPNGQDVVAAITHPELRNLETGVSGFSIGRMVPGATLKKGESAHPTYDTDIPGQLIGRSKYPTPYEIAFPDTTAYARSQLKPGVQEFNMMKLLGPRERIDQQYVDEMKTFEELMKQYTGKKKGGAVKSGLSSIKKV